MRCNCTFKDWSHWFYKSLKPRRVMEPISSHMWFFCIMNATQENSLWQIKHRIYRIQGALLNTILWNDRSIFFYAEKINFTKRHHHYQHLSCIRERKIWWSSRENFLLMRDLKERLCCKWNALDRHIYSWMVLETHLILEYNENDNTAIK